MFGGCGSCRPNEVDLHMIVESRLEPRSISTKPYMQRGSNNQQRGGEIDPPPLQKCTAATYAEGKKVFPTRARAGDSPYGTGKTNRRAEFTERRGITKGRKRGVS